MTQAFTVLGFPDTEESLDAIEEISHMEGIRIEGMFSHLVLLDDASNKKQYEDFCRAIQALKDRGVEIPCCHLADSIASVDYPEYRMDMIRAGAIIYGLKGFHKGRLDIKQALTFKTRINHITEVKAGEGEAMFYVAGRTGYPYRNSAVWLCRRLSQEFKRKRDGNDPWKAGSGGRSALYGSVHGGFRRRTGSSSRR